MTDRARTAGWTAAAVLGPVAAAVFAGTTVWSAAHAPAPPSTDATSIAGPVAAGGDPQQIIDETARIADLEHLVATLRARAALLVPGPAGARAVPGSAGAAAAPPARAASRPPITARAAARPPAVHAVTGASSATKGKP
jgi:hypothetical protein